IEKRVAVGKWPVGHIGPDPVMAADGGPQGFTVPVDVESLDRAETAGERQRFRSPRWSGVDHGAERRIGAGIRFRPAHHGCFFMSSRKNALSSGLGVAPAKPSKRPCSAISLATRMKTPQVARASALPTLMRRVPSAARSATVNPSGADMITFTGFGATALMTAPINSRV